MCSFEIGNLVMCGFISGIIEICPNVYESFFSPSNLRGCLQNVHVNFSVEFSLMYTQIVKIWVYVGVFESTYVNVSVLV